MGGRRSRSKKNQNEGTLPPVQDLVSESAQSDKAVDSVLLAENDNLKKENESLLKEVESLRIQMKLLEEKLQNLEEHKNKNSNSRTSESVMEIEHNTSFEYAHNETLNETDNNPADQEDGAWGSTSKSKCVEEDLTMQQEDFEGSRSYHKKGASRYEKNAYVYNHNQFPQGERYSSGYKDRHYQKNDYQRHDRFEKKDTYRDTTSDRRRAEPHDANRRDNFPGADKNHFQRNKNSYYYGDKRRDTDNQRLYSKRDQISSRAKLIEIDGDLFSAPQDNSLAHCVAADLRMGSGIAVRFKQDFNHVDDLLAQKKRVGDVAILEHQGRYIYYLITKKFSTGKPRLLDLKSCLWKMREHMEENGVMSLAIPRIGCGLDRLHWREVRDSLYEVFADLDLTITVYNFTVALEEAETTQKKSRLRITDQLMELVEIERNTLILLFGSECGYVDSTLKKLDEKFRIIDDYKNCSRKLGDVVKIVRGNEIICILIVKSHHTNFISYLDLSNSLAKVKQIFRTGKYYYMGFSAFVDEDDDVTVAKIVTLFKNAFNYVESELWICWPPELENVYYEYFPDRNPLVSKHNT